MEKLARKEAFTLGVDAYYNKSSVSEYTAEERQEGLRNYLADLNKDFRANKNEIFQLIEDTVNAILPVRVYDEIKQFADFQTFAPNTVVRFRLKNTQLIKATWVALGGSVERVRVDNGWIMVTTTPVQCKVYEEYERIIGGQVDWSELVNMCVDAIQRAILTKIYQTLIGMYGSLPTVNCHTAPAFDIAEFDKVINVIKAYGRPIIIGTPQAVQQIPVVLPFASDADRNDIRNQGYLGMYKGISVIEIPNSFEDVTNSVKIFDDEFLFILPAGNEKVVKVALEGGAITRDVVREDWTYNFELYQKVGVATLFYNYIGMYKMTNLA